MAETDQNGASVREYIWLDDMPIGVIDRVNTTPVLYYVHADHLDRPAMMTNAAKANVWSAVWSPFGVAQAITGSLTMNGRFPGQWFQIESGLHWNWHRHYDPSTGRYLQPDPMGLRALLSDGPSVYGYARQSPFGWRDPSGTGAVGDFLCKFLGLCDSPPTAPAPVTGGFCPVGPGSLPPFCPLGTSCSTAGDDGVPDDQVTGPKYGATPEGRPFTKHYGTETGPERNIPGSVVDQTINTTEGIPVKDGKTVYYDPVNDVTVVSGDGGSIVSARRGPPGRSGR